MRMRIFTVSMWILPMSVWILSMPMLFLRRSTCHCENRHAQNQNFAVHLRLKIWAKLLQMMFGNQSALQGLVVVVSFWSLTGCGTNPQTKSNSTDPAGSLSNLRGAVETLASMDFEGRETGTAGERKAAEWISAQFSDMGLTPKGDSAAFQSFRYKPHPPMQMHGDTNKQLGMAIVKEIVGYNVLYFEAGQKPASSKPTGVVGAHYDHLGYGDENSLFRGEPTVHFGADDNASGVSVMLELARRFSDAPIDNNLLFAAFSGEEKGLWGSNHFCGEPTLPLQEVRYMINMDMVGRLRGDTLAVYGTGTSPEWMNLLESCNEEGFVLVPSESGVGPSDHTSFYLEDIPVLHFFTGQHPDYHRPTDTPDKINYNGMLKVAAYIERLMRKLDSLEELPFTATKDEDNDSAPSFKVTLGVVPDYLFSGEGMRIDGLTEGRPASNAGMKRGDIVVRMDTVAIVDMMSYMQALSVFEEGQTTEVEIIRKEEHMTLSVLWD